MKDKLQFYKDLNSSCIKSLTRVGKYHILVEFTNEKLYLFYNAAPLLKRWLAAPSKGKFFWYNVRDKFRYSKVIRDV